MITSSNQLKAKVRNISKGSNDVARAYIRIFFMERFLERVSHSEYKDQFILKGGMLAASLLGIDMRSTMDIDTTVKALSLTVDDISTDDEITPRAIEYDYRLMFEERTIMLFSYNVETLLAEKLQTVLARNVANTRMRDFFDIYSIYSVSCA
uniref:Nucleotidyl transferase AbiEii/AbiGii toxin family protein n=1 Tax=Eubacterium cellulosolvens (strain ATCC 43171 / JCM 9499 / 6) TaxID=633697 RepID=I5AXK7_EUBC6